MNDYLREITGKDITAKDFRTWAGTVLAAMALNELESFDSAAQAKRNLRAAIEKVSARLGNTPTICRKCYVHPEVLNSYMDGNLVLELKSKAESELRAAWKVSSPKRPRCSHCCAAVSRKRRRVPEGSGRAPPDYSGGDVEQGYSPSFEKLLALSLIAFIAILGPFHPMISSFLSSSSSVAMKNFSSSC